MDRYFKHKVLWLFALCVSAGCVEENLGPETGMEIRLNGGVEGLNVYTKSPAEGVYPENDTELSLSLFRWDDGDVSWPENSQLDGELGQFTGSEDGITREISFSVPQYYKDRTSSAGFTGIYPRLSAESGWQSQSDGRFVTGDRELTYKIDGRTDVMISDFVSGSYETGIDPLTFRHALCMYNFYIYAVDENSKSEWGELSEVKIVNLPESLKAKLPKNTKGSSPEFSFDGYPTDPVNETDKMKLLSEYSDVLGENYELPVGLPADISERYVGTILGGSPKNGILGLAVETLKAEDLNSVSIARDFRPGYIYNIVLRFSTSGIINADVTVENWSYGGRHDITSEETFYNDLSRYGTANCYVVSSANMSYCFDATVKGNGVSEIWNERTGVHIPLLGESPDMDFSMVDHARVLRSDALMKRVDGKMTVITDTEERQMTEIIDPESVAIRDGKILFTVPGNPADPENPDAPVDYSLLYEGNVKIGLCDKNDNIIWSWHIWVTDMPLNQNYLNGYVSMDRNLGAVVSSKSEAETEWTKLGEVEKSTAEFAWGLYYQFGRKDPMFIPAIYSGPDYESEQMAQDISETHKYPMKFYYDGTDNSGNWISGVDTDHLWGYVSQRDDYVKTMYDPCPPGYRVPEKELWEQHDAYGVTTDQFGTEMYIGMSGNGYVYYPTSHLIYKNDSYAQDTETDADKNFTYLLSATPSGTDQACHFRFHGEDTTPLIVPETSGESKDTYKTGRAVAYPVRCVLESSGKIVTDLSEAQTANSYIIPKTGFYKFKADVRGNGATNLTIYTNDSPELIYINRGLESSLRPSKVDLLWWQGGVESGSEFRELVAEIESDKISDVSSECPVVLLDGGRLDNDGYVTFYARVPGPYGAGNVGLAAYDENSNIVWTWHLWLTPELNNIRVGDYTLMDRNLGATWAPASENEVTADNVVSTYGFYYQWGRKDPFFPPDKYDSSDIDSAPWLHKNTRDGKWTVKRNLEKVLDGPITLEESANNPLSFSETPANDWQSTYTDEYGARNNLWGYTGRAALPGNAFSKTMYDPCPPGYRVMPHYIVGSQNELYDIAPAFICYSEKEDENNNIIKNGNYSIEKKFGIELNYNDETKYGSGNKIAVDAENGLWLPLSGRLNQNGHYTQMYESGYLSTSTTYNGNDIRGSREIKWSYRDGRYYITENHTGNWMTDGRPVRCVKE